jgi:hypothetical protein
MRHTFPILAVLLALLVAATPAVAHHGKGSHADGATSEEHGSKPARSDKHGPKSDKHGPKSEEHSSKSEEHSSKSEEDESFAACDWQTDPDSCPGNSGWAHWCKLHHGPGHARGQCVAEHAGSK